MFVMNLFSTLNNSLPVKIRTVFLALKHIKRNASQVKISYELKSHVAKDVLLFNFENPKFFVFINIFSAVQCFSWSYLGIFLFQSLNNSSALLDTNSQEKFWGKVLGVERKYSSALSVISVIFGWSILAATSFYSLRSIRKIILHKGGKEVTIITYNLPGFNTIKVPLNNVSSFAHRTKAKKYIPVKLKNKFFYYLIDVRGEFSNPTLFDFTAGVNRNF